MIEHVASCDVEKSNEHPNDHVLSKLTALRGWKEKFPAYRGSVVPTHFQEWVGEPDYTAAHEAWLASLPSPSEAPLTPEEVERAAMLQRRSIFMANLRDGSLDGQSIRAAATSANIFTN